jgi:hypothetical protein
MEGSASTHYSREVRVNWPRSSCLPSSTVNATRIRLHRTSVLTYDETNVNSEFSRRRRTPLVPIGAGLEFAADGEWRVFGERDAYRDGWREHFGGDREESGGGPLRGCLTVLGKTGRKCVASPGLTPSFRRSLPETGCLSQGLPHGKRYAWPCPQNR